MNYYWLRYLNHLFFFFVHNFMIDYFDTYVNKYDNYNIYFLYNRISYNLQLFFTTTCRCAR